KINFVVSGQGQEAAQIGAGFALDRTKDYIAPYYRDLGLVLYYGMTTKDIMLSAFGKHEDLNSAGRKIENHLLNTKIKIISVSSPKSTQITHTFDFVLASKIKNDQFVTFTTLGDVSMNQGHFHEGLNFSGVHEFPVITMVENNKYAIS